MGKRDHTVEEIKEFERQLFDILTKLREFKDDWEKKGPEVCQIESDLAARYINYLETWVPRQQARVVMDRQKAAKEEKRANHS